MRPKTSVELREYVRERADFLCEYCHTGERWQLVQFTIDHVVPVADGGSDGFDNLALACFHCNRKKSDKQTVVDPNIKENIPPFNPRSMVWKNHFRWSDDSLKIVPTSKSGKVTLELLQLNRPRILQIRQDDTLVHRHPPDSDLTTIR